MRRAWMHWQNLTDTERIGHPTGSILRHGRAWLHLGRRVLHCEWMFLVLRFHFGVHVNRHDEDLCFHVGLPGFSLYFSLEGFFPRRWKTWDLGRSCGIRTHSGALWLDFWTNENGWSRDMPWYAKTWCFNPADFFLGRRRHAERTLDQTEALIPMPEGTYPVTIRLFESTWRRPRWPFPLRLLRAEVRSEKGIPVPGKGENAWDCGEDAVHGSTFPCGTFRDAVAEFTKDILTTRGKHGGLNWRPAGTESNTL